MAHRPPAGLTVNCDLADPTSRTRVAVLVIANAASLGFLYWTLRDARLSELGGDFAALNWWLVALAIACQTSAYFVQSVRWHEILAPLAHLGYRRGTRAVFVGLFASEALPIRAGEVLRCYLVSRWTALPISVTLSSVIIERTFDGLLMWVSLEWIVRNMTVSGYLRNGIHILGIFVVIGCAFLAAAILFFRKREKPLPAAGWRRRLAVLIDDLARIGHSRRLIGALLLTIPYLGLQAAPVWLLFKGYGFGVGWPEAIALMMLLRTTAAIPQAPATLGLFQVVTKEFLVLGFMLDPAIAARFSLVLWGVVKLPLLAGGAIALTITGAKLGELRREAAAAQAKEP